MNSNFIDFLFDNYLPYAFIWSGFVYRCLNSLSVTRLTNGTMERHIRTKKSVVTKACLPALYINNTVKLAIGQERIKELNNLNNDEDNESENEYDSNSDSGESKAEENASTAEDTWAKTQADKMKIKKRKRKNFTGCYQKPQRIDLGKKKQKSNDSPVPKAASQPTQSKQTQQKKITIAELTTFINSILANKTFSKTMNRIIEQDLLFTKWSANTIAIYERMISTKYDFKNYFSDCSISAMQAIYKSYSPATNESIDQSQPIVTLTTKNSNINLPKRQVFKIIQLN
jgi:hypothetical protein